MATFDEFYESLPEDSNKRGEYFEKVFVPWFLRTDPEWSTQVKEVWLWDDYPHRWGKDCGIDLVYADRQGNHWAVQSKCISPEREISKAEIDSFLSESSDSRIHGRLLIASTDGIGKNAQQVIDRQEKQVVCFLLEHFRHSEVEFPSSSEDLSTGHKKEKRKPRPHQEEAIKNVVEGLQKQDRGQLLMACGTGKTLTSLWIKEALKVKRTLVLLPSLSLLSQTLREWTSTSQQKFNWICVCSDKSVAQKDKSSDPWLERSSEIGVPVTSDPNTIADFITNEEAGVIFSTYQSSQLIVKAQESESVPPFDIAFADEAHRCAGKISDSFGSILDGEKIRSKKRLFMTATPRLLSYQLKVSARGENIDVASMDDTSVFGNVLHKMSFLEAIEKNLLCDYKVVIIGVDDDTVQSKITNRTIVSIDQKIELDSESLANHIAISKAVANPDYKIDRMITFHGRVKGAKDFSSKHPNILNFLSEHSKTSKSMRIDYVSGKMNTAERSQKINSLKNIGKDEVSILSNARCLSEGVDVPALDAIAFIDPKRSMVDIIQAVGRVIRKSDSKQCGYIFLPIYLGEASSAEEQLLASRFGDIWNIILALKSQDDALNDVLDRMRIELGRRTAVEDQSRGLEKIIFDLPETVSKEFSDAIKTQLVCCTTENWQEMYGKLLDYVEAKGDALVPHKDQENRSLGAWVVKQRMEYRKNGHGTLTTERIALLNSIDFVWEPKELIWNQRYQELISFRDEKGHCNVPSIFPDNQLLGNWVATQRARYKYPEKKDRDSLTKDQINALERIGFIWDVAQSLWDTGYSLFIEYREKHGNVQVPSDDPCHKELYKWMCRIRTQYKKPNHGYLSQNQIDSVEKYGFIWDTDKHYWEQQYKQLIQYIQENGNARVPTAYSKDEDQNKLTHWVGAQRKEFKKKNHGNLDENRIKLLDAAGFIWDPFEAAWHEKYNELIDYQSKHGDTLVPGQYPENPSLGAWVNRQRNYYKNQNFGSLSQEKIELLQKIEFIWDAKDYIWRERYQELLAFIKTNGHAKVPSGVKELQTLSSWVYKQRQHYRKPDHGLLSEEQIELLNEVGFIWSIN